MGLLLVGYEFTAYQYALMSLIILAPLIAPLFNIYHRRKSK